MSEKNSSFIKVDELLPQVSLEQAADFYGISLPEMRRVGDEVRMRCFLACGRSEETGDRAIAVQMDNPVKPWKCHVYQCQKGGNLVGLCDLMAPGANAGGKPRGQRFKQIAADLVAMTRGEQPSAANRTAAVAAITKQAAEEKPPINLPLAESDNERARELVTLDQQFVTDVAAMPPEASAYFRRRPFLTPEVCQKFALGYLPHSSKSLLRGQVVYGHRSPAGELLTWFGRNVRFEEQLAHWKASDRSEPEPIKTRFVKGFHRGLELYAEDIVRRERLGDFPGVVVVEGPNDAIRLNTLRVPAVALCSNTITQEQVERIAALACDLGAGSVTLMLDCDEEGVIGTHQVLPLLAEKMPVRLAWSSTTAGGKFKGRQPESLTAEERTELLAGFI